MIPNHVIEYMESEIVRHQLALKIATLYRPLLAETVSFSPNCYITIRVYNRPDLQLLMQLAPMWTKSPFPDGLYYKAMVEGHEITLIAYSGALPKTCKFVDEEEVLPAEPAKPERRITKKVLKCSLNNEQTIPTSEGL